MERLRPYPVTAFCALTLLIWVSRVWLAWTVADGTLAQKLVTSVPITAFVVAAAVLLLAIVRGVDPSARWFVRTTQAFAAGTILFWAIRLPQILLHQHPVPFKVVHTVLAMVSIAAAAWAWSAVSRRASAAT
ncbi:MAG: hypothetical protein U0P45_01435 [Acidimicrobiales bacterium]